MPNAINPESVSQLRPDFILKPKVDSLGRKFLTTKQVVDALRSGQDRFFVIPDEQPLIPEVLSLADNRITIDTLEHSVAVDGDEIYLSITEFKILQLLALHKDTVQSRAEIFSYVWNDPSIRPDDIRLNTHVQRLRGKLGEQLGNQKIGAIRTIRTIGYLGATSLNERAK